MATIIYRGLDKNHEPLFGQGKLNFISDIDAVAQAILTRLLLFEGEWWESKTDGLPLWQSILGKPANQYIVNLVIQQRIALTPYVIRVQSVNSSFDSATRSYKFSCTVLTQFGTLVVSNQPTPPAQGV